MMILKIIGNFKKENTTDHYFTLEKSLLIELHFGIILYLFVQF